MLKKTKRSFPIPKPCLAVGILVLWACQLMASIAFATEANPLQPIDTSSPRATLQGFLDTTNKSYAEKTSLLNTYLTSQRLFLAPGEVAALRDSLGRVESAERTLDLSELPPATVRESSRRLILQLKEILDRIGLPPFESIPDEDAMAKAEFKRWTSPARRYASHESRKGRGRVSTCSPRKPWSESPNSI
jgi:MscS family membrane protein